MSAAIAHAKANIIYLGAENGYSIAGGRFRVLEEEVHTLICIAS